MRVNFIGVQSGAVCEACGETAELRPYGKNGANVCFKCAMKDEQNAKELFIRSLEQGSIPVEDLGALIHGNLKRH